MTVWFASLVPYFFDIAAFSIPLTFYTKTSELFEFNKIILLYILTTLILSSWLVKMIIRKKVIFRRTILDIPLLIFLFSMFLATVTSIDVRTSIFGYYSRFNGGLLSSISYVLLYFAFTSNMDARKTLRTISAFLISLIIVSIYGAAEHFGVSPSCIFVTGKFNVDCWVQDVQTRVFATLGQPNWLAAWLVALIPLTWAKAINSQKKIYWLWIFVSALTFSTLLYTKSRSGLMGFALADVIFTVVSIFISLKNRFSTKKILGTVILINIAVIGLSLINGTPWTPSIFELSKKQGEPQKVSQNSTLPALEVGGTESGKIREIVWKGAIEIWKHYPILGTGVETFGYSYWTFRPAEHNLVSEWDFVYNKAHNEYLNYMSTTGTVGISAYLVLIAISVLLFYKNLQFIIYILQTNPNLKVGNWSLVLALLAGFASILVTNFFGFSVVPVDFLFFLFPAIAITLAESSLQNVVKEKEIQFSNTQKVLIIPILLVTCYLLLSISRYWYADTLYAKGKGSDDSGDFASGRKSLLEAVSISKNEALYWNELSLSDSGLALAFQEQKDNKNAVGFSNNALAESQKAVDLSPRNLNIRRVRVSAFIRLSQINSNYLKDAESALLETVALAPTDAKLFYNLGLIYAKLDKADLAIETLDETVAMKANYKDARLALALILRQRGEEEKAKTQLHYILENIDPNDTLAKEELAELEAGK